MPDDRRTQLQKLHREHDEALAFSEQIAALAAAGDDQSLAEGVRLIREYYDRELETHLQLEEQTLLARLLKYDRAHLPLCMRLGNEHGLLRSIATSIDPTTAPDDLPTFARVLKEHTVFEEEEFLPLVASLFTHEELDAVLNFSPLPTRPASGMPGR